MGVSISQNLLDEILNRPRIQFSNLNKNIIKSPKFLRHIGTTRKEVTCAGVYIWTHVITGNKYVGSSYRLARRLVGYFKGTHADTGKFIPLLKSEGLGAFNLTVIPLIKDYEDNQELSLEQYFLLHSEFNLNTLKVVNDISGSKSKAMFMYIKDFSKLIYYSNIQEDFIFKFKIHYTIFSDSIKNGSIYLGKYIFTDRPRKGAKICIMSDNDLLSMLEKDRLEIKNKQDVITKRKVILIDNYNNIKNFCSISKAIAFLNTIAPSYKTTLYRYIKSGKSYHGFKCKWGSEKTAHISDQSITVHITNESTGITLSYPSFRKAALSFTPSTTGQTLKSYAKHGNLFRGIYRINYLSS